MSGGESLDIAPQHSNCNLLNLGDRDIPNDAACGMELQCSCAQKTFKGFGTPAGKNSKAILAAAAAQHGK